MIRFLKLSMILLVLGAAGCATFPGKEDSVTLQRLFVTSKEGSPYFVITAVVSYDLVSMDDGVLAFGLDSELPGRIRIASEKAVHRGSGTVELSAEIQGRSEREILSIVVSLNQTRIGPAHPPLAYRKGSLKFPQPQRESQAEVPMSALPGTEQLLNNATGE